MHGRARLNLPGQSGGAVYAIPRAELSGKTANFSKSKAKYEDASRVYSRGAFSRLCFALGS